VAGNVNTRYGTVIQYNTIIIILRNTHAQQPRQYYQLRQHTEYCCTIIIHTGIRISTEMCVQPRGEVRRMAIYQYFIAESHNRHTIIMLGNIIVNNITVTLPLIALAIVHTINNIRQLVNHNVHYNTGHYVNTHTQQLISHTSHTR